MKKPCLRLASACLTLGLFLPFITQGSALAILLPSRIGGPSIELSEYIPLNRGSAALHHGDNPAAIRDLKKALWINPTNILALFDIGCAYFDMAKTTEDPWQQKQLLTMANESFERVTDLNDDFILPYFKIGKIALMQDDSEAAKKAYLRGLEIDPDNATLVFNLARVYDQQNERADAIREYRRTIALNPKFSYAYNNLALIYEDLKRPEEAEKLYVESLKQDSQYNLARLNYANLSANQGNYELTRRLIKQALVQEPDNSWAYYYTGNLEMRLGHYGAAVKAYQQSIVLDNSNPTTYYLLALADSRLNNMDEALQASLHYLQMEPDGAYAGEMQQLASTAKLTHAEGSKKPLSTDATKN